MQGRYEEYRLLAITYSTDEAYDTTFTIVAGDKETLAGHGLDARAVHNMPELLAARPIYRPDLNLTKENMHSQCIFFMQRPQTPGWDTPTAIERCHQTHRHLTQIEDRVEM